MSAPKTARPLDQRDDAGQHEVSSEGSLCLRDSRRRVGAELSIELRQRQKDNVGPERSVAEARLRRRISRIDRGARVEGDKLERKAEPGVTPKAKADLHRISDQRQI